MDRATTRTCSQAFNDSTRRRKPTYQDIIFTLQCNPVCVALVLFKHITGACETIGKLDSSNNYKKCCKKVHDSWDSLYCKFFACGARTIRLRSKSWASVGNCHASCIMRPCIDTQELRLSVTPRHLEASPCRIC